MCISLERISYFKEAENNCWNSYASLISIVGAINEFTAWERQYGKKLPGIRNNKWKVERLFFSGVRVYIIHRDPFNNVKN